jgi:hypothetical protein
LKINELKRMIRYTKLKPLKLEDPVEWLVKQRQEKYKQKKREANNLNSWSVNIHSTSPKVSEDYTGDNYGHESDFVDAPRIRKVIPKKGKVNKNEKLLFTKADH